MKVILSFLTILCFGALSGCNAQSSNKNKFLVFKVEYSNSKFIDHAPTAYSLIEASRFRNFIIKDDSLKNTPNITYNITANGGLYVSESFTDLYTLGCCEYQNVEKAIEQNVEGKISKDKLKEYASTNQVSVKEFNEKEGFNLIFREGNAEYNVTVWQVELNFCNCPLYMENPQQVIFGNRAAYIRNIEAVSKPTKKMENQIRSTLQQMINVDLKYQK